MLTGIICVDDERIVIESIKNIFSRNFNSYVIEFAQSSSEVFDILEEFKEEGITLALIISDYIMPGTKGDHLLIKVNESYPDAKKIMLTGQADLEAVGNVVNKANLYRYISKPWDSSDLILTIKEALKSFHNEQSIKKHTEELEAKVEKRTNQLQESLNLINEHVMNITTDKNFIITNCSSAFKNFFPLEKYEGIKLNKIFDIGSKFNNINENNIWKGELCSSKKTGVEKWLSTTCTLLKSSSENGYKIIMHDITHKKKIEKMLVIDPMTGLYNRRFFYDTFPELIKKASEVNSELSFILLDIDKFKQFNDLYGHQKGDDILKRIALVLMQNCTSDNFDAIRLGGEEFAVIASDRNHEEISQFCERLRADIEALKIVHESNPASQYITASFGVFCSKVSSQTDLDYFYTKADELLYIAKENGRNRIEINNK